MGSEMCIRDRIRPGVLEKWSKKKKITRHDLVASNEEVFRPIGP